MANKHNKNSISLNSLLVPRAEAERKIKEQIEKGRKIRSLEINSESELGRLKIERFKWSNFNRTLFNRLFGDESIADQFPQCKFPPSLSLHNLSKPIMPGLDIAKFRDDMDIDIIKLENILGILDLMPEVAISRSQSLGNDIFVVHGRDQMARQSVVDFIESLGLHPVILQEEPNIGRTVIEKLEDTSNVGYAVVLMTPDDIGALQNEPTKMKPRARQNVILELGYFMSRLGRDRICVLYKDDIEMPSDLQGVLYVQMDSGDDWRSKLAREIESAGMEFYQKATTSQIIGPTLNISDVDSLVLKLSCEKAIETGLRRVTFKEVLSKAEIELKDIDERQLSESLQILEKNGYISNVRYELGRLAPILFTITVYGFQEYAEAHIEDYHSIVKSIVYEITEGNKRDGEAISAALKQPIMIVRHVLEVLASRSLIDSDGNEITKAYPGLRRILTD